MIAVAASVHDLVRGVEPVAPAAEHERFAKKEERLDDVADGGGAQVGRHAVDGAVAGADVDYQALEENAYVAQYLDTHTIS